MIRARLQKFDKKALEHYRSLTRKELEELIEKHDSHGDSVPRELWAAYDGIKDDELDWVK